MSNVDGSCSVASNVFRGSEGFCVSRITRTQAHGMGVKIYDSNTREAILPEEARAQALDTSGEFTIAQNAEERSDGQRDPAEERHVRVGHNNGS